MIAPEGIRESFTGGGDWRKLPCADGPWTRWTSDEVAAFIWPLAVVLFAVEMDGERRCLLRYDVEETERGKAGLWVVVVGARCGSCSL